MKTQNRFAASSIRARIGLKVCLLIVFLSFFMTKPVFCDWVDAQLFNNHILNPSVSEEKVLCILSGCLMNNLYYGDYYITDYIRFNNHKVQFNNSASFFYRASNGVAQSSHFESLTFYPCLYFTGSNLAQSGDLYVFLHARFLFSGSGYVWNFGCYKINDVNLTDDTVADIESYSFNRVTNPQEWIYPLYYVTSPQSLNFSTYLTRNVPSGFNNTTAVLSQASQSNGGLLQMSDNFSLSWLRCSGISGYAGALGSAGTYVVLHLTSNKCLYADQNLTEAICGSPAASSGPAGYVAYAPSLFNIQNDFDRGGQIDWSEYYSSNKDMKLASDDNPSSDEGFSIGEVPQAEIDPWAGQSNLDPMLSSEAELPTQEGFDQLVEDTSTRLESTIAQNSGYQLLQTFINPNGFNINKPLPRYTIPVVVNAPINGGSRRASSVWDFGNIEIDFNILRREPYWTWWQLIRSVLATSLFIMTFIGCYAQYEKALAWSA